MAVKVQADRNAFLDAEHSLIVLGVSSRIVTGTRAERFISSRAGHELLLIGIESLKALSFGGREAFLALKVIVKECAGGSIARLGNIENILIGVRAYRRILIENIIACAVGGAGSSQNLVYTEFRVICGIPNMLAFLLLISILEHAVCSIRVVDTFRSARGSITLCVLIDAEGGEGDIGVKTDIQRISGLSILEVISELLISRRSVVFGGAADSKNIRAGPVDTGGHGIAAVICEDTGGRNHDRCNEHYGDEQRHYLADFSCLHNYHLSLKILAPGLHAWRAKSSFALFSLRRRKEQRCRNRRGTVHAKRGHLSAYLYHYTVTLFYSRLFCLSTEKFKIYIYIRNVLFL